MANIQLAELNIAGSELFQDTESFLNEMNDNDGILVQGGSGSYLPDLLDYSIKTKEFALLGFAIDSAVSLAKSFSKGVRY
ncbi:hypothetical protein WJM97_16470 [Okeanomitos corallinicola TIOX110]|uniref:Uncharacterized protein n=1 Tax=Okeanomitos corallinicola TIOX110 TaxID=3133117 RepID=A0ABZ2UNX2_9CYAN